MIQRQTTQIELPTDMAERLTKAASEMGLTLPAYLVFLERSQSGRLDAKAQEATRFVFSQQKDSLRKLSQ